MTVRFFLMVKIFPLFVIWLSIAIGLAQFSTFDLPYHEHVGVILPLSITSLFNHIFSADYVYHSSKSIVSIMDH